MSVHINSIEASLRNLKTELEENSVRCPSCGRTYHASEWNDKTLEVVSELNNSDEPIRPYNARIEGTLYRCPNTECEDEVITDSNGNLKTQE